MSDIAISDIKEIESKESAPVVAYSMALIVDSEAAYSEGVRVMAECANRARSVEDKLAKNKKETYAAYKGIMDLIKELSGEWLKAKDILQKKTAAWKRQEDARREQERAAMQREAQKKAEEDRLRMAIALEAKKAAPAVVDRVMAAPVVAAPVVMEKHADVAKEEGVSWRENWSAEVVDLKALIGAAHQSAALTAYLLPNMPALNAAARTQQARMEIPGVKAVVEKTPIIRRAG